MKMPEAMPTVVLISGRGTNMTALLDTHIPGLDVRAVICNRRDAPGLDRAHERGVETVVIDDREFSSRADFDEALAREVESWAPRLVVLAGFMRVLAPWFVERHAEHMLNIHPSLLPSFPGLATHRRAIEAGVQQHGATVHFVTPQVDAGPIIVQAVVPVLPHDSPSTLAARVLEEEHRILPQAVRWFVEGRLALRDGQACLDGKRLAANTSVVPVLDEEKTS